MKELGIALRLLAVMSILTGLAYPAIVTFASQAAFPAQANGSVIRQNGVIVGSRLIGQSFDDPKYFWGRISATTPFAYNAASSSGSGNGPTNPALLQQIDDRVSALRKADPSASGPVPTDLATSSGSGLDPHISIEAARFQASRVAHARGMTIPEVNGLIDAATHGRQLGLGETVVNVLELNLALDAAARH